MLVPQTVAAGRLAGGVVWGAAVPEYQAGGGLLGRLDPLLQQPSGDRYTPEARSATPAAIYYKLNLIYCR